MHNLSENQLEQIRDELVGSQNSIEDVMEQLMIDSKYTEEIENAIQHEYKMDICPICNIWTEAAEMVDSEYENVCIHCAEEKSNKGESHD